MGTRTNTRTLCQPLTKHSSRGDFVPRSVPLVLPLDLYRRSLGALCVVDMDKNKDFSAETNAQIIALKKSGKQTKAISEQIGVCPRSVRRWVAKFDQEGGHTTPTHKKRPGKPKKTDSRSHTIVKHELESNPRVTARKLKESNPDIFGECSMR
ncbi:hypothetical protein GWK47_022622 [Chionoecetes opilio]|uniref:Uncharacterized protein n=1 Tax=Chionoecetes opilio TaxID=41210 RepID=A0A8J4XMN6_CHIOP|nr:hypothetical protein GWK47_022622 [Chionoecetes opilio]